MLRRVVPAFLMLALLVSGSMAHGAVARLDGKVVPTQQAIRLSIDSDQSQYRGSVRIDLQVRERTDRFRFHSNGPEFTTLQLRSASRGYRIDVVPESEGVVAAWMQRHSAHAAIVRPDHYTFGSADDEHALSVLLNQLTTDPSRMG